MKKSSISPILYFILISLVSSCLFLMISSEKLMSMLNEPILKLKVEKFLERCDEKHLGLIIDLDVITEHIGEG